MNAATTTTTTAQTVTAREFIAGARAIVHRESRIPMANSQFEETVVMPDGSRASFLPSKLDVARFRRALAKPFTGSDCMGRVTVAKHGWIAEFSARGFMIAPAR